jgi:hypothetical protein
MSVYTTDTRSDTGGLQAFFFLLGHFSTIFQPLASTHPSQRGRLYLSHKVTLRFRPLQTELVQGVSCKNGYTAHAAPRNCEVVLDINRICSPS